MSCSDRFRYVILSARGLKRKFDNVIVGIIYVLMTYVIMTCSLTDFLSNFIDMKYWKRNKKDTDNTKRILKPRNNCKRKLT